MPKLRYQSIGITALLALLRTSTYLYSTPGSQRVSEDYSIRDTISRMDFQSVSMATSAGISTPYRFPLPHRGPVR